MVDYRKPDLPQSVPGAFPVLLPTEVMQGAGPGLSYRIEGQLVPVLHLALSADVIVTGKGTFTNLADAEDPAQNLVVHPSRVDRVICPRPVSVTRGVWFL